MESPHNTVTRLLGEMRAVAANPSKFQAISDQISILTAAYMAPHSLWNDFRMSGQMTRIADLLHSKMGKIVSRDAILNAMYFDNPNGEKTAKNIDVQVFRIRKQLRDKFDIETIWGQGYKMTLRGMVNGAAGSN